MPSGPGTARAATSTAARTFSLTSWREKHDKPHKAAALGGFFDFPGYAETRPAYIMSGSALYETFARAPLAFDRGEGAWLVTDRRRATISISPAGIAVNALGHATRIWSRR